LSPEYLIPLKARAWLNLSQQLKTQGNVDEKNVRKHKNDIIRLYQLLSASMRLSLPRNVQEDMQKFLKECTNNPPDLKALGLKHTALGAIVNNLSQIYNLVLDT
jgi:hypothetical protein